MAVQDKSGVTNLNPIATPSSCMHVGIRMPPTSSLQSKELCLSRDEHAPKVRKPYTITKQRERWTEEEHKKFLEALKLHGRAWRRIEEHIGTKNAVQIRSHAQKFFSKVVRESAGSSAGNLKPLEIPPPRPKRKPMHPYPRKLGHSSNKGIITSQQKEKSTSPTLSVSEQENRSPISVLSAAVSEIMGSSITNLQNHCTSPDSSATGSNPVGLLPSEQENICGSPSSSVEEENGSNYQNNEEDGSPFSTTDMKLDSISRGHLFSNEGSLVEVPATTLKLFGRTVLITDSHKLSSVGGNTLQSHKLAPSIDNRSHLKTTEADLQSTAQTLPRNTVEGDYCGATCQSAWNPWSYGVPPVFCCMPFQKEPMNSAEATTASLPWWALYGGLPFPFIHTPNMNLQQNPPESCTGSPPDHKEMHKEGSWTGSDTTLVTEAGISEISAFTSRKSETNSPVKGFVPYKRCVAEREVEQSQIGSENRESQRIRQCL